jgi:hypothetical protein
MQPLPSMSSAWLGGHRGAPSRIDHESLSPPKKLTTPVFLRTEIGFWGSVVMVDAKLIANMFIVFYH